MYWSEIFELSVEAVTNASIVPVVETNRPCQPNRNKIEEEIEKEREKENADR